MDKVLGPGGFTQHTKFFYFKTNSKLHSFKKNQASTLQEYGGSQGNCLGTDNKLGEDVVFLNVEN